MRTTRRTIPTSAAIALLSLSISCGGSSSASISASGSASVHSGDESASSGAAQTPSTNTGTQPRPSAATPPSSPAATGSSATTIDPGSRYIVVVDSPHSLVPRLDGATLSPAHVRLREAVDELDGVAVANEPRADVAARMRADGRVGLIVQCSILRVDVGPQGTRAAVSMVVVRLESDAIVGSLSGGALAPGSTGPDADRAAVAGAIESATRGLPQLLASL